MSESPPTTAQQWRQINYRGVHIPYEVSPSGRVRSITTQRILTPRSVDSPKAAYVQVCLRKEIRQALSPDGSEQYPHVVQINIRRLVKETFGADVEPKIEKEVRNQAQHHKQTKLSPFSGIDDEKLRLVRALHAERYPFRQIAAAAGIKQPVVEKVIAALEW